MEVFHEVHFLTSIRGAGDSTNRGGLPTVSLWESDMQAENHEFL